ncbi:MAG TPA: hypothetical protein VGR28_04575 [Candidatus Thermoplasmatota archaeon]|jgi:hypothetical protein|nr:hypothetical protein [Candidatus Thermoplasmatota archaeon]
MTGTAGRCQQHANLSTTPKQRQASRRASRRSGFYADLATEEDLRRYRESQKAVKDPAAVKQENAAFLRMRAHRVAEWEVRTGKPSDLVDRTIASLNKALDEVEPEQDTHTCLSEADMVALMPKLLEDKEMLVKAFPLHLQAEVRKLLEASAHDAAPA